MVFVNNCYLNIYDFLNFAHRWEIETVILNISSKAVLFFRGPLP